MIIFLRIESQKIDRQKKARYRKQWNIRDVFLLEITIEHDMEGLENPWASLLFVLHLFLNYKAYTGKLPELKNYMH